MIQSDIRTNATKVFPANKSNAGYSRNLVPLWMNRSLEDLPGEIWKELPGTEGYYVISNMGRVKCFNRTLLNSRGILRCYKGHVLKQVEITYQNKMVGDSVAELVTTACFCGMRIRIRIAKMVYELFVENRNKPSGHYVVIHRNGNRYDNRVDNLCAISQAEKATRIYKAGRGPRLYNYVTSHSRIKASIGRQKEVTQYNGDGEKIAVFESIKTAALQTGVSASGIAGACKANAVKKAGGFFWMYGNGSNKIDVTDYNTMIDCSRNAIRQAVTQFSIDGVPVAWFSSIKQAAATVQAHVNDISAVINGRKKSCRSSFWKKGHITQPIAVKL